MEPIKIVEKVWGREEWLVNDDYCVKKLYINKGCKLGLHYHEKKDELFYIISGRVLLNHGSDIQHLEELVLKLGDSIRITPNTLHTIVAFEDSLILESSTHHEDSDSYRIPGQESRKVF